MQRNKPCVISHGGRTCDATGVFAGTSVQAAFLLVMIGMSAGFGVYYALRSAGIVASIGTATTKDSFDVGSWFRYDIGPTRMISELYLIAKITGITTAGDATWGDPIAAAVLGPSARWYKWDIKVYLRMTNNEYPYANYKNTYDYLYLMKYLLEGYSTTRMTLTPATFDASNKFHVTRPMFVNREIASPYNDIAISGNDGYYTPIKSYIDGKKTFTYNFAGVSYDKDTGILLATRYVDTNGQTYWMALTAFSVANPMINPPPVRSPPTFTLTVPAALEGTIYNGKRLTITNYESAANYELYIVSTNQSVIANVGQGTAPITFSTLSCDLNVLRAGTTTLTISVRSVIAGVYSVFTVQTIECDTKPTVVIPPIVNPNPTIPSTPILTVTPYTSTNGTIFLSWTASTGSPDYYQIYFQRDVGGVTQAMLPSLIPITMTSQIRKYTYQTSTEGTYAFVIRSSNSAGASVLSLNLYSLVDFPSLPPPPPPASTVPLAPVLATPTIVNGDYNENVSLTWSASTGATSYNVYRRIDQTFSDKSLATLATITSSTSFVDTLPALYQKTVYYAVTASNLTGQSALSTVKSVIATINTTYATSPVISLNSSTLVVSWNPIPYAIKYFIYLDNTTNSYKMDAGKNTTWDFNAYLPWFNSTWHVTITAITSIDDFESLKSNSVNIIISNYDKGTPPGPRPKDYGHGNPPIDTDIIILVVFIIVIAVTGVMVVFFLRQKLIKKK